MVRCVIFCSSQPATDGPAVVHSVWLKSINGLVFAWLARCHSPVLWTKAVHLNRSQWAAVSLINSELTKLSIQFTIGQHLRQSKWNAVFCKTVRIRVISGFRRDVSENFILVGFYAAWVGSCRRFGTTCWSLLQGPVNEKLVTPFFYLFFPSVSRLYSFYFYLLVFLFFWRSPFLHLAVASCAAPDCPQSSSW